METINLNKNITEITCNNYVVPLYQRNYAWSEAEIHQLLHDIYAAFKKDERSSYFIGSLVVLKRKNGHFEVIDGQQRLTTISLISNILDPGDNRKPMLHYDSRPEVEYFMRKFYENENIDYQTLSNIQLVAHFKEAIIHIKTANLDVKYASNLTLENLPLDEFERLKEYFFQKVILIQVEIPNDIDVAHYFEIMNNRGEQLEKHEILKAQLLDKLKEDQKNSLLFSKIWDACSQMHTPIQKLFSSDDRNRFFRETYQGFNDDLADPEETNGERRSISIQDILDGKTVHSLEETRKEQRESKYVSIIEFPDFLMHVFKLTLETDDIEVPLNSDELLNTFYEIEQKIDPLVFMKDLLFYRVVFDRCVIKSLEDEKSEDRYKWSLLKPEKYHHEKRNKLAFKNSFDHQARILKNLSMLQVTFRTKKYKNWLHSLLSWFKSENDLTISASAFLKKLDALALALYESNTDFQSLTESASHYSKGTNTPHYLFNFIDYLFWVQGDEQYGFEFKYRNSIEHHLPQSFRDEDNRDFIDSLGNLCLVSKGANSRMSDRSPIDKAERKMKFNPNSLPPKQKRMYELTDECRTWGVAQIEKHFKETYKLLIERKGILGL